MMDDKDYARAIFAGTGINLEDNADIFWRAVALLDMYANEKKGDLLSDIAYDEYDTLSFTRLYIQNRQTDVNVRHDAIRTFQDNMHKLSDDFLEQNKNDHPDLILLIEGEWDRYLAMSQERRSRQEVERKQREYDALPWYKKILQGK